MASAQGEVASARSPSTCPPCRNYRSQVVRFALPTRPALGCPVGSRRDDQGEVLAARPPFATAWPGRFLLMRRRSLPLVTASTTILSVATPIRSRSQVARRILPARRLCPARSGSSLRPPASPAGARAPCFRCDRTRPRWLSGCRRPLRTRTGRIRRAFSKSPCARTGAQNHGRLGRHGRRPHPLLGGGAGHGGRGRRDGRTSASDEEPGRTGPPRGRERPWGASAGTVSIAGVRDFVYPDAHLVLAPAHTDDIAAQLAELLDRRVDVEGLAVS